MKTYQITPLWVAIQVAYPTALNGVAGLYYNFLPEAIQDYSWYIAVQQSTYNYYSMQQYFDSVKTFFGDTYYNTLYNYFYNSSTLFKETYALNDWHLYGSSRLGVQTVNRRLIWRKFTVLNCQWISLHTLNTKLPDSSNFAPMRRIFLLVLGIFTALNSMAWGAEGHHLVAQIARQYVSKKTADSVNKYLDTLSWEQAAVWMDELRSDKSYDYMKTWHYVNVEKDKTYVANQDADVVNKLQEGVMRLQKRDGITLAQLKTDVKVIFHLVGDIHQPLHAGYGTDKGGNSVEVTVFGKKRNLHRVWDSEIIDKTEIKLDDCLKLAKSLGKKKRRSIQQIDVNAWMMESRALLPQAYDFSNGEITQAYFDKNKPVVQMRLVEAGLRLAAILNKAFDK